MIQTTSLYGLPQIGDVNAPVGLKDDLNKNPTKVVVQISDKEEKLVKQFSPSDSVVQKGAPLSSNPKAVSNQQLLCRYIFLVDDKTAKSPVEKTHQKDEKKSQQENAIFHSKCDHEEHSSDEDSESSIEVVEGHEVVLKTSSEKTTADDQDYLQLLEAHQQRLEDESGANDRRMASQGFVNQANFENDMAVRSGSVASADFTHGLQVTAPAGHAKSSSGVQIQQATAQIQQATAQIQQQQQHTQQVLHTIAPDSFPSNNTVKNEGFGNSDVHFVEGDQSAMYANGSGAYSYGDTPMFGQQGTPVYMDGNQHQPTYTTSATTPTMVAGNQGQILQVYDGGMRGQAPHRPPITHTTRASPATVSWLLANYETSEGVSLPRSTLYNHYLQHCQSNKLDAVNAASFGKLIRSVFVGLRTRRLGTRGNSKYHYYGIRIQPSSPLNALVDPEVQGAMRQSPSAHKRIKLSTKLENEASDADEQSHGSEDTQNQKSQQEQHQQYLGDISQGLPAFQQILITEALPDGITNADIAVFAHLYREHSEAILDVVVNLQFALVESLWQTFWRAPTDAATSAAKQGSENTGNNSLEERLPKTKLTLLCNYQPVLDYVKHSDHVLYQALVETLIPAVLRPIPGSLTSAIRNYAKCLESWLMGSMTDIPQKMVDLKISTCSAFSQTLRRYTSLNHLAQAARAVLQNPQQINQMLTDLNRVDFANVQEQASWVCQCDEDVVNQLETDFKETLAQQNSLEKWAEWLEAVVNKVLLSKEGTPAYPKAARQFLLKWSFYSSMVIRDLTLRSAASFGSFHLIRLLYDEYMFYLIEHKVAAATGKSPIAVMGEFVGLGASLAAALGPMDSLRENGEGDSGSDATSEDAEEPCSDKDVEGSSSLVHTDEPDSKKQRTS